MTLCSVAVERGRAVKLMTSAKSIKMVARTVVVFVRKSDVRRTPNVIPSALPPSDPAKPPPLLACISTTIISKMLTKISRIISTVYILSFLSEMQKPQQLLGFGPNISKRWVRSKIRFNYFFARRSRNALTLLFKSKPSMSSPATSYPSS